MKQMKTEDFTTTIVVDQSAGEVMSAVTSIRHWWSEEIEGSTNQLNKAFTYHYKDIHFCRMKLVELVPNKKAVYQVLDNLFSFTKDKSEWIGTNLIFEITEKEGKTQLQFTHQGLVPSYECYDVCHDGWTNYIQNSLYQLITEGKGEPNKKEGGFNAELAQKWNIESKVA